MNYSLLILLIPLFLFVFLGLLGKYMKPLSAGILGTIGIGVVALISYFLAFQYFSTIGVSSEGFQEVIPFHFPWLKLTPGLIIGLGIFLDPISVMMLVVITTVSWMVHIYSLGYMKGEKGFQRYYALLSLFSFSMLGLVVATNIFQMYIFWELVGVSSYSLIGFYYTKPSAIAASKKAFIVTRFADLGFLIGILLLSYYTGSFDFNTLTNPDYLQFLDVPGTFLGVSILTWTMSLIFMGGAGKSAMMPLHIWLPDAMEGPTPVSALIHAATMVVAGVFLVARMFPVYALLTPEVLQGIAWVGVLTALFAAVVACTQTDIKRVLAFSTISQIAYMMVSLGVSGFKGHEGLGYMASMFHLFTHAFFKALLFLGAGVVIHAVHSNEMKDMGGLRKHLPVTHATFLIACLSIAGIPPFSGFFSKDEIMAAALGYHPFFFLILLLIAGLTAFYMFRLYFSIFWRKTPEKGGKIPHEAPVSMTLPLVFLALLTIFSGFLPFSSFVTADKQGFSAHISLEAAIPSVLIALAGILIASGMYRRESTLPDRMAGNFRKAYQWAFHKFYFDEIWIFIAHRVIFNCISRPVAWFDRHIVDGFMNLQGVLSYRISERIKGIQSGNIQHYTWFFMAGALVISLLMIFL